MKMALDGDGNDDDDELAWVAAETEAPPPSGETRTWRRHLYASHMCAAWGARMWEFLAGLVLLQLAGGASLRTTAALSLAESLAEFLLSPAIGRYADTADALRAPVAAYAVQNASIAGAALAATAALGTARTSPFRPVLELAIIVAGTVARLGCVASTIAVEKRWVRALAADDADVLATTNGAMRRIDLTCKILAPALAGVAMSLLGTASAAVATAALNILAWPVEVACLRTVYAAARARLDGSTADAADGGELNPLSTLAQGFHLYRKQPILLSTLALAMLYFTVLSFGSLMTAYVYWAGLSATSTGIARGLSALCGIAATYLAPAMFRFVDGPRSAGTLFAWIQNVCLLPAVVALLVCGPRGRETSANAAVYVLMVSVVASRVGLWGFDLSVTQMIQTDVEPPSALGIVSGVQSALQSLFGACIYILGMILPHPAQFPLLVAISYVGVTCAALCHTVAYLYQK